MKQNRSPYWSRLVLGIISVLMVAAIESRDTWATYTSAVVSGKNVMRGGSIELSILPDAHRDDRAVSLAVDAEHSYHVVVKNDGSSTLGYQARFVTDGDADFCGALQVTAKRTGKEVYVGTLVDFAYLSEEPLERHQTDAWQFSIGMPESVSEFNETVTCELRWHLDAWQDRFLALGMGWYDGVDSDSFTVGIEPVKDKKADAKEPALLELIPDVPSTSETSISDRPLVPTGEIVPNPETTLPEEIVVDEVPSETELVE